MNIKRVVIGCVIIGIIVLVTIIAFSMFSEDRLISAIENGDSKAAVTYFENKVSGDDEKEKQYKKIIGEKLATIQDDYKNEKIDFETAEKQVKVIQALGFIPNADRVYEKLKSINTSRTSVTAAKKALKEGKIKEAIIEFNKVTEEDELPRKEMEGAIDKYKEQFTISFEKALDNDDYEKSKELFEELIRVLPQDSGFRTLQENRIAKRLDYLIDNYNEEIYHALKCFDLMGRFLSDINEYEKYEELTGEAYDWFSNSGDTSDIKNSSTNYNSISDFLLGKWQRADGGRLDGMVIEFNGIRSGIVVRTSIFPGYDVDTYKWNSMQALDENTIEFDDTVRDYEGNVVAYYGAIMKLDRKNNLIHIKYYDTQDVILFEQKEQVYKKIK